jgi:hypothetical protein
VGQLTFFFFQSSMSVDISNEARVIYGVKGNIDLLLKVIGVSEWGEVVGVGYERRRSGTNKGGRFKSPSIWHSFDILAGGKDMVAMVNIVVVELNVVGVFIVASREVNFLAILDMVLKTAVIDHVILGLSSVLFSLGRVRGLFQKRGGNHTGRNEGRVM